MTKSWPRSFYWQLVHFSLCFLLGATLIDGIKLQLFPYYFICFIPALYLMLALNDPSLFLSDYSEAFESSNLTFSVTGMKLPIHDKENLAEDRYLKVHGDYLRRAKRMLFFWGQLALSYAILVVGPLEKGGIISLALVGAIIILSSGRGHLLLALVVQSLIILMNFKFMTIPIVLVGVYLFLSFSLLAQSRFERSYMWRGAVAAVVFILLFLFVDWMIPSPSPKWAGELVQLAKEKAGVARAGAPEFPEVEELEELEELEGSSSLAKDPPLSFAQVMGQLDSFEQMLLQGEPAVQTNGGYFSESNQSLVKPIHLKRILAKMKTELENYSDEQIDQLLNRLENLCTKLEENSKASGYVDSELAQFRSELSDFKDSYSDLSSATTASSRKAVGEQEKIKKSQWEKFKPFFSISGWIASFIFLFFLVHALFKKRRVISEEEEEARLSLKREYRRLRQLFKSNEEEVILTYQLVHRGLEKLYYLPHGICAPPPEILASLFDSRQRPLMIMASIFSRVQYGRRIVSAKEMKLFRRSFKRFMVRVALRSSIEEAC